MRRDALPTWFTRQHPSTAYRFTTAYNTPLYFNSLFAGKNLYDMLPVFSRRVMFNLYWTPPANPTLLHHLEDRGVASYLYSNCQVIYHKTWWSRRMRKLPITDEPWFLLWHEFGAHAPQLHRRGSQAHRREQHRIYLERVDLALRRIVDAVARFNPDRYIVMGDHGEEFYDDEAGVLTFGHGTFDQPILTENVRDTVAYVSDGRRVSTFPELFRWVLN